MGLDISSKLMYGLFYKVAIEGLSEEEIDEVDAALEDGEIEYASPYYDASREEWFIGFEIGECFDVNGIGVFTEDLMGVHDMFIYRFRKNGEVQARHHVY